MVLNTQCIKMCFCNISNQKGGNRAIKEKRFSVLKVSWYKFKLECYNVRMASLTPVVATKNITVEYRQKPTKHKTQK